MNEIMHEVRVIDDFHIDPMEVRKIALSMQYEVPPVRQGRPGGGLAYRIDCAEPERKVFLDLWHETMQEISIKKASIQFRYTLGDTVKKAVCHADGVDYAGICYLSLPEQCQGGTSFYRHIPSGDISRDPEHKDQYDFRDPEQWELTDHVEMKFNRLVYYPGELFHAIAAPFFGENIENARLTQNMFINIER